VSEANLSVSKGCLYFILDLCVLSRQNGSMCVTYGCNSGYVRSVCSPWLRCAYFLLGIVVIVSC
jgi:hypothetical protein